jgi:hypothetical protein
MISLKIVIFQFAMLVYQRVTISCKGQINHDKKKTVIRLVSKHHELKLCIYSIYIYIVIKNLSC